MKRGVLKQSELIQSIGWKDGNMDIKYRDDGAVFVYLQVAHAIYLALQRSKNPGQDWLKIRDRYKYRAV